MTKTIQMKLIDVLNAYGTQLEELITLLREEHNILQLRDLIALEDCTRRKHSMLERLMELQEEQVKLENMQDKNINNNGQLIPAKEKIQQLLTETKQQNDINGSIIDISKKFSQHILNIIFGKSSENKYYDSDGKDSHKTNGHTLAKI